MSGKKRQSTLFNFFPKQTSEVGKENSPNKDPKATPEDSDDEEIQPKKRSRFATLKDSSESESEAEKQSPQKSKSKAKQTLKKRKFGASGQENGDGLEKKPNLHKFLSIEEKECPESLQLPTNQDLDLATDDALSNNTQSNVTFVHSSLEFLKPENIRDISKRRPSDPEYDSRTLYVPESFLNKQTPVMFQWWQIKSKHLDTVLFLKVGKFYELYHMDAVIGVQELGFSYMKGEIAHSGFPESAYGKMASQLIEKGYKVARIEQTETPEMMENRLKATKKPTKYDRVVKRELCQISSIGNMVYTAQLQDSKNKSPHYMYAICVKNDTPHTSRIGVCFAETSIGSFHLTEFEDDKHFSKLLVLLNEYPVSLILTERKDINKNFNEVLEVTFRDVKKEYISPKTQLYTASDTLEKLAESSYFKDAENKLHWPPLFKKLADNYSPKKEYELAIRSLGICLWYLKDCNVDIQVFSAAKFEWYDTCDQANTKYSKGYMVLDSTTITNLNLLHSVDSLQNILSHCCTPFGHRLLHRWICRPLYDAVKIKERQNAVRELRNNPDLLKSTQTILSLLPDLERQLTKIRIYGNKSIASDHPDGRAIFYEELTYSKRKIEDFTQTIEAFERVQEIPDIFKNCEDTFLRQITQFKPVGINVDLRDTLTYIKSAVDLEQAAKDGKIIPKKGFVKAFDEVEEKIEKIQEELDNYLQKQCKIFGCKVTYVGNKKNRYQLSIPANKNHKVSAEYQLQSGSTKKGTTLKYSTPETTRLLAAMIEAEGQRSKVILDLNRCIFEKFGERHEEMNQVIQCLAILDVICSFAQYAYNYPHDICMPDVLPPCDKPRIAISNGRNPCIDNASFVPNDTFLGQDEYPSLLVLTGPNMGGKSTLIKQTALIAIMAHIGSFVPAAACEMNLIDRIFTRLGAQDDIIEGQSTFYTELSETSIILKYATKNSFVLIDELGRGTSTHDGNAIATAVLTKVASFKCRGIFSTHFHSLVDRFEGREDIQIGHMACMEESENDATEKSIIFLFKLAKGKCSKSYGFNVAKLAGVDNEVIVTGREIAKQMEEKVLIRLELLNLFTE